MHSKKKNKPNKQNQNNLHKKTPNKAQPKNPEKKKKQTKPNKNNTGRERTCNCSCKLQVLKIKSSGSVPLLRLIFIKVKSIPSREKKQKPDKEQDKECHHNFCSSELLWIIYLLSQAVQEKWDCGCHGNVWGSVLLPQHKRKPFSKAPEILQQWFLLITTNNAQRWPGKGHVQRNLMSSE